MNYSILNTTTKKNIPRCFFLTHCSVSVTLTVPLSISFKNKGHQNTKTGKDLFLTELEIFSLVERSQTCFQKRISLSLSLTFLPSIFLERLSVYLFVSLSLSLSASVELTFCQSLCSKILAHTSLIFHVLSRKIVYLNWS